MTLGHIHKFYAKLTYREFLAARHAHYAAAVYRLIRSASTSPTHGSRRVLLNLARGKALYARNALNELYTLKEKSCQPDEL